MRAKALIVGALVLSLVLPLVARDGGSVPRALPRADLRSMGSAPQPMLPDGALDGTWTLLGTQPPGRFGHGFVYDSKADRFILFGGVAGAFMLINSTWSYDVRANAWTNLNPVSAPSPRVGFGMVYDSRADRVILFGGQVALYIVAGPAGGPVPDQVSSHFSDSTWSYDFTSNVWTNLTPASAPSPRANFGMVYDAAADRTILFGGYSGAFLADTWAYDYNTNRWTQVNASGPSPRYAAPIAYDERSNRAILFGGGHFGCLACLDGTFTWLSDTWAYDYANDSWTNMSPISHPSARGGSGIAYDPLVDRTILFGGGDGSNSIRSFQFQNDTWTYAFAKNEWSNVTPAGAPPARIFSGMDYDGLADRTVLFGGTASSTGYYDDAWSYHSIPPPPTAVATANPTSGTAPLTVSFTATVSDGLAPFGYLWAFGDGATGSGAAISHTYAVAGIYTAQVLVTDSLGRSTSSSATVTVNAASSGPTINSFTASASAITLGASVTFTATATGGTGALTYAYSGLPSGCASRNVSALTCMPTVTGSYTITVTVTDSRGERATAAVGLTVNPQSNPSSGPSGNTILGLPALEGYGILAAIATAVAVGGTVAVVRSRHRRPPTRPP